MKKTIHIVSFLLLLASFVVWIQGCTEGELQKTKEVFGSSAKAVQGVNSVIPPVPGTLDLKFLLASLAAIIELVGGVAGGIVAQKKISTKTIAVKQIVTGIDAMKVLYPEFYPMVKACQAATQTGYTPALVAKAKAGIRAAGDGYASPIDLGD